MISDRLTACSPDAMTVRHQGAQAVVGFAWPTGRPIYPYTVDELADGVDLYTRALKVRRRIYGGCDAV